MASLHTARTACNVCSCKRVVFVLNGSSVRIAQQCARCRTLLQARCTVCMHWFANLEMHQERSPCGEWFKRHRLYYPDAKSPMNNSERRILKNMGRAL